MESAQRRHQSQGQSSSPTPASPLWSAPEDTGELLLDLSPSFLQAAEDKENLLI